MNARTRALAFVMILAGTALAAAQAPAPPGAAPGGSQDPLAALRAKSDFSEDDLGVIREFVGQRIAELVGQDPSAARQAAKILRQSTTGGDAFRRAYANAVGQTIASAVQKSELGPATQLVAVLDALNVIETRTVLTAALGDARVGVRAAAAVALRRLRPRLAQAGPDVYQPVISALRDAAIKEKSRETLRAMYQAISYVGVSPPPSDMRPCIAGLIDVLEARAKLHTAGAEVPAVGAEDAAFPSLEALAGGLSDDEKRRAVAATAGIVRYALDTYLSPKLDISAVKDSDTPARVELRNDLERLVLTGERVLVKLVAPPKPPTVFESMRKLNRPDIRLQWKAWSDLIKTLTNQEFPLAESDSP